MEGVVPKRKPKVDESELEMAETLIDRFTSEFDHSKYRDEYRKRLLEVVKRKGRGEEVHVAAPEREAPPDLLEALRASVEAAKDGRSKNGRAKGRTKTRRKTTSRKR